jgi:hypothetical protein
VLVRCLPVCKQVLGDLGADEDGDDADRDREPDGHVLPSGDDQPAQRPMMSPTTMALTVPEVRRLQVALVRTTPVQPGFVLAWSR